MSRAEGSPRPGSDPWVAAIHLSEEDRRPVGSGFLIDGRRVLTCAHVVFVDQQQRPELWVALPKAHGLGYRRVRVREVIAPPAAGMDVEDVAILVLAQPVAEGYAARLRQPETGSLVGHRWWAFGFPDGMLGNSAHGVVGEELGYGWVRLDTGSRHGVKSGYSGAALWSSDYQAVVGMVGQAQGSSGDARAITVRAISDCLPGQKLSMLSGWSAEAAGESALAAWGWSLETDPEAGRHWRPRARGVHTDTERGFRFRGRTTALTEIRDWLTGVLPHGRVLVVTGSPGVGKSAVLGRIVTTADPAVVASLPSGDTAVRAVERSVACAVHAKGKTALEVAAEIARAASARLPVNVNDLATDLGDTLKRTRRRDFTVIIDALDEAASPEDTRQIIRHIARRLAEDLHHLGVRVVVGTRRQDDLGSLLEEFGTLALVDLDTPRYFARADLSAYALATLQLRGGERADSPYNAADIAQPVADRIAQIADGNFLVAALIARAHGLHDTRPVDTESLDFHPTVDAALASYLTRLSDIDGVPATALMTALAYAEAPGLTIDLWRTTVAALGYPAPGVDNLQAFARSSAANFLVESSTAESTVVHRLFHQALNDALVRHRHAVTDEANITRALLDTGRRAGWNNAPEYLLRSLPGHARRGHALDALLADDTYPLYADLRRLIPASVTATTRAARERVRLLRLTPRAIDVPPGERAALLSINEALHGLGTTYRDLAHHAPYRARWATPQSGNEEAVLEGHTGPVRTLRVVPLPDGSPLLLTTSDPVFSRDRTIRLWDPNTGGQHQVIDGPARTLVPLCTVSLPTGRTLLAAVMLPSLLGSADPTILLWDLDTGTPHRALEGHADRVIDLCTVPVRDGRTLLASASRDRTIRLWDPDTGEQLLLLEGHTRPVTALCTVPQPNGRMFLASASDDGTIGLWDPDTGSRHDRFKLPWWRFRSWGTAMLGTVQSEHERTQLVSIDLRGTIRLWDPDTGRHHRLGTRSGRVAAWCTVSAADGRTLLATALGRTAGGDRAVRLWHPSTGGRHRVLEGHTRPVNALCALTPVDGHPLLASASDDRTIRLWDPRTGEQHLLLEGHTGHVNKLCTVAVADGRTLLASASDDRTIRLWDPATGNRSSRPSEPRAAQVNALCTVPLPDGHALLATASSDHNARLWDPATGEQRHVLEGHTGPVTALCTLPRPGGGTLLATASSDHTVRLWDPDTGDQRRILEGHTRPVEVLCALTPPEGRTLLASGGKDRSIRIWDPDTGRELHRLKGHTQRVSALCQVTLSDGRTLLASGSGDCTVRLWDPVTGRQYHRLKGHTNTVHALCIVTSAAGQTFLASAPGGPYLATDHTVRLWDPETGDQHLILEGHTASVSALCTMTLPDGRTLLATASGSPVLSSDRTVRLWDPETGDQHLILEGHTEWVSALCTMTLPDGRTLLASSSGDRTVRLWNSEGAVMAQIPVGDMPTALVVCDRLVIALENGILAVDIETM